MDLEKVFQEKVEKLPEEKKLEVISSEESNMDGLLAYFEKNKYEELRTEDECRKYFVSCMDFLQSFKLTPEIIVELNTKIGIVKEKENLGLYLSAMIQTSYNQGWSNFKFEEVNAVSFGAFLKGQPKNPIKITAKTIEGAWSLGRAENCSLKSENIEGYGSLWRANGCLVEIKKYKGEHFGWGMRDCIIKSGNKETLELIKKQTNYGINNKLKLKKISFSFLKTIY